MQADVLVLDQDPPGLEGRRHIERLLEIGGGSVQAGAQLALLAVGGEGDAIDRADVDARVALDAELAPEDRLDVAAEAALRLLPGKHCVQSRLPLPAHV